MSQRKIFNISTIYSWLTFFSFVYNRAAILFIVEDVTYNICDQRFHEFEIRRQNPKIRVLRRNLTQLGRGGASLNAEKKLIM